jgi:hypothetical protein
VSALSVNVLALYASLNSHHITRPVHATHLHRKPVQESVVANPFGYQSAEACPHESVVEEDVSVTSGASELSIVMHAIEVLRAADLKNDLSLGNWIVQGAYLGALDDIFPK